MVLGVPILKHIRVCQHLGKVGLYGEEYDHKT